MYESDAKMLAGKEKREMEQLFGKRPVSTNNTAKKYEPSGSSGKLPSMFASGGGASGTLLSSGSASTMKVDKGVFDSTTGGAKAVGHGSNGGVSKMNMGSYGVMDTSKNNHVDVANRGGFAGTSSSGSVSKLNMGSAGVMDKPSSAVVTEANRATFAQSASGNKGTTNTVSRGPDTQYGVLRKMPWEKS